MIVIGFKVVENKPYSMDQNGTHYEGVSSNLYLYLEQKLISDEKQYITNACGIKTFEVKFKMPVNFVYDNLIGENIDVLYNSYRQAVDIKVYE